MAEGRTRFEFRAGSFQESDQAVRRIVGEESLSQPYGFEVDYFLVTGEALEPSELCDTQAVLTLRRPDDSERHVHGLVGTVRMTELQAGVPHYRARIVSRLERQRHRTRSRIFQEMSVPDIVKQVLDEAGMTQRWSLISDYPEREYCVQYQETDHDFVSRLLEEVGIFYFFEHSSDDHTVVLLDSVSEAADSGLQVPYKAAGAGADEEAEGLQLFRLERRYRSAASKVSLRDYDFVKPGLDNSATTEDAAAPAEFEWYEYPGGFSDPAQASGIAQVRLEEHRSQVARWHGESSCTVFQPGSVFEAVEHPDASYNGKLLLLSVSHEGNQDEGVGEEDEAKRAYRNTFEALEATTPFRATRRTVRPRAYPTTATVVGSSGEEIFPDDHGRVKVQFHWDREGQNDDKSSCWMRVAQPSAGPGFGGLVLPRVGQEVLVKFLGGDPDRPLVTGATYNGQNPTPISLPDEKTSSVHRSDSSPGGGGSNELRFEDRAGGEGIHLQTERDHTIQVVADKVQTVGGNESLRVDEDRDLTISGNQNLVVTGSETDRISGRQTLNVGGNRDTEVAGSHTELVAQGQTWWSPARIRSACVDRARRSWAGPQVSPWRGTTPSWWKVPRTWPSARRSPATSRGRATTRSSATMFCSWGGTR